MHWQYNLNITRALAGFLLGPLEGTASVLLTLTPAPGLSLAILFKHTW
jgi:hypothetical protein